MRTRLLTVLLVFGLAVSPLVSAQAASPRILVLGDSLSAAYNMPTEAGWVALLAERLGDGAEVVNAAIGGETTAGARARLPEALDAHAPDIVVIALGGNDGLRSVPLGEVRDNLEAMIRMAREAGASVILAGVRLPSNYGSAFIERFRNVYEQVARETGVAFVPMILAGVAERASLMQDDGIHPNTAAQPLILENIWQALGPMLSTPSTG